MSIGKLIFGANLAISFTAHFNVNWEVNIWYSTSASETSLVHAVHTEQVLMNGSLFSLSLSDHEF